MTIVEKQPYNNPWQRIQDDFLSTGDAHRALAERTASVDRIVMEAAASLLLSELPQGLALLAVGGYGRRQLFPHSDVDLLLLFADDRLPARFKEPIAVFLRQLWDSGLRLSHSVRTPAECAELHDRNIELNVSLLDQRLLCGDRAVYNSMADRMPRFLHAQQGALARNLTQLARERHARYQQTFYHLEPNVKDTPGGLRDHQLICWLDQLHRPGRSGDPPAELHAAWTFLARIRCFLHYQAKRDQNLLGFEAQDEFAGCWFPAGPAAWMREYFRHARDIYRTAIREIEANEGQSSSLFSQFRDWRSRLSNADFTVSRERVHLRAPQHLDADPDLPLRLFAFGARPGIRPSAETEDRVTARVGHLADHFSAPQPLWPALREILTLPHAPMALRSMHETRVLQALFPELNAIDCLVVRDFYHRYTVDEHTLVAIQELCSLRSNGERARQPYADLLSEIDQPGVLIFALLFHDSGKGSGSGHVGTSLRLAESAMERIHMPEAEREEVRFLIRSHMEMSQVLQSRDLHDPHTLQALARHVGTVERLRALTLVTWADVSAVNPGVMTPWRSDQLWQLYMGTYNELNRELESDRIERPFIDESPEKTEFLEGFPTRYLRTQADSIEEHMRLEASSRNRGVAVQLKRLPTAWRLTLVTRDRPYLFAAVAGTLAGFGMNILKADAFANRRGVVLDTFTFEDPMRSLDLNPPEVDRLRTTLERVILGKMEVKQLLHNRPRPAASGRRSHFTPAVAFDGQASRSATLIEIVAEDRPGLLYELASAISSHGCNIEVVLIDTEAHKAIDVFYVTYAGTKLSGEVQEKLGDALRTAVQAPR